MLAKTIHATAVKVKENPPAETGAAECAARPPAEAVQIR
jgi:hypothetical protein